MLNMAPRKGMVRAFQIGMTLDTLAAAVHLQRYHHSSTTESMRQRNNNNSGLILLVFLLQKSSI